MGSVLFDFLTESWLFHPEHVEEKFANVASGEIIKELQRYREFCLSHREELISEAVGAKSGFRIFPGAHSVDQRLLKQSALYVERYILADPIFPFTEQEKPYGRAMRKYLGEEDPHKLDRAELAEAILRLKSLTPMVAADYVKFIPVSYLFESPEELPLYYSKNRFSDVLPADLLSFFRQHKNVHILRKEKHGWIEDPTADLTRNIAIDFGDDRSGGMLFQLFDHEVSEFDEATGRYTARLSLPEELPEQASYDAWVEQSINRTAINCYDRMCKELTLSMALGASYMCISEFRNELLTRFFPVKSGTAEHSASVFLHIDVPFIDEIDTDTLMRLRRDEGEAFQVFRHELERQLWDLRVEENPEKLRVKAEKVMHDLATVQHEQLTINLHKLRRGVLADAVILSAALVATIISTHLYWPAIVGAVAGAYKLKSDHDAALRQNPSFFLWKARRR